LASRVIFSKSSSEIDKLFTAIMPFGESGANQHPIPEHASTPFRWKPAPDSGTSQQVIPEYASRFL
jgi:hypothetical protein